MRYAGSMLERLSAIVKARLPGVWAIYLFGSRARGDALADSDYDIALLGPKPLDPVERWKLQEEIAAAVHANVDLVDLRRASAVLRVQVLKDALVLFDGARADRDLFEATALSDYARLNEERRGILADIAERGQVHG